MHSVDTILTSAFGFAVMWGAPFAWMVFQIIALIGLRGRSRLFAAIPMLAMAPSGATKQTV
jgi:hypothetical protein